MDPYSFGAGGSMPDEEIHDYDDLERLEQELLPQSDDYYGVLNVSKKATDDEIKVAYKKLCRFYHPDKHNNDEHKKIAEARFQVIQRAYEVLSNRQTRVIYDIYGEDGLQAKWEVGPKYKTPEELQAEYEKKARLKREKDLENLIRSNDEVQVVLDATQILDPYEPPVFNSFGQPPVVRARGPFHRLAKGNVQQLFLRHSFETELGPQTRGLIGCSMVSRNGMGGGNLLGTLRHTYSPKMTAELTATLLRPRGLTLKTFYSMSSDSFCNTTWQTKDWYSPPIATLTVGRRLFATTTGYLTYRTGEWHLGAWGMDTAAHSMDKSSVALGLAGSVNKEKGNFSCELQTGILASHVAGDYTHKVDKNLRVRVAGSVSTMGGVTASIGSDHKISSYIRVGMSMECGVPAGVTVKFKVSRLGQKLVIPVLLSSEWDLRLTVLATVVPASVGYLLDHLLLKPKRQAQIRAKIHNLREQHADILENRKAEALDAQKLIQTAAERKAAMEAKKRDGLVIVKALYGNLTSADDDGADGVIDVTIVLQAMVNESRLTIPGGHSKVKKKGTLSLIGWV
ncbi:hypothetical protein BC940DRAFT_324770 [Gongronella butleri]|nr:hypothetical protein BC940DRAFT_324770 [Gongronella butleri]